MKPYWRSSDQRHAIYHAPCLDVLPSLKADAVVTDPPFGIGDAPFVTDQKRTGKRIGSSNDWHPASDWDKSLDPAWGPAVCSAAQIVAWFGQWRKREEVSGFMDWPLRAEIVWAKDCHAGPPAPLAPRDERIWIFSARGIVGERFETSVWDSPVIPTWERKRHKNEKPLELMARLLRWLPAASIIDPFMGSGTTGVACVRTGRRFVGVDIDEECCEGGVARMEAELAQGCLFTSVAEPIQESLPR